MGQPCFSLFSEASLFDDRLVAIRIACLYQCGDSSDFKGSRENKRAATPARRTETDLERDAAVLVGVFKEASVPDVLREWFAQRRRLGLLSLASIRREDREVPIGHAHIVATAGGKVLR